MHQFGMHGKRKRHADAQGLFGHGQQRPACQMCIAEIKGIARVLAEINAIPIPTLKVVSVGTDDTLEGIAE